MKRTFLSLFTMLSCLFFVSCGDEPEVTKKESQDNQQEQKQNDDQKPDDGGTKTDTPEEVKIENGTIKSAFSVSSTQKVYFSTGNLQYQASAGTWQFAENQYDVIGKDNSNISSTNAAFIDLFGWGTSGWENGVEAFQPYSTEYDYAKYYVGGSSENNLVGSYANADWGVYNSISNGGGKAGMWRTLTAEEWYYVIKDRKNAYDLYSVAKVNGVNGLILLPDNWTTPSSIEFTPSAYSWATNVYTADEWEVFEKAGAVFLPAGGYRSGSSVSDVNAYGAYWSTTGSSSNAYCVWFNSANVSPKYGLSRDNGTAVRLVTDVQ